MIELEELFDLSGIELSERTKKKKAPIIPNECRVTLNKNGAKMGTRFSFLGSYAEVTRPFDNVAYGLSANGVHFFFAQEKFKSASFKLQKGKTCVYFCATPKTDKEEKILRMKYVNKSFEIVEIDRKEDVLHLYISLSNSQPLETSQEEQENE